MGARLRYARPALLCRAGMLAHFYTDAYAGRGSVLNFLTGVSLIPRGHSGVCRRLLGRREESLPRDKVTAFNLLGFRYYWALRRNAGLAARLGVHLDYGRQFCRLVLANSHNFSGVDGVYAFPAAAAPLFRRARETGVRTIFEQNSTPIVIDSRLVVEEHIRWPGWELPFPDLSFWEERSEVEQQEWDLADAIICPTPFVAQGLESQGVDPEKIRVVPYGVEVSRFTHDSPPWDGRRPLRLLFAGGVMLRKGVQYLHQALEMLNTPRVSARLVGFVGLLEPYRNLLRQRAELTGLMPRSEMFRHYQWADVFVFPSISEGSAIVTYEALAAGLPVITTTNAGSMVRHRVDGYVLPIRDARGLAESIERLLKEAELVAWMSQNARQRAQEYSWERFGGRLVEALNVTCQRSSPEKKAHSNIANRRILNPLREVVSTPEAADRRNRLNLPEIPAGSKTQIIVAHMGARLHYAHPLVLCRAGMLAHFYTDAYAGRGSVLNFLTGVSLIPRGHSGVCRRLLGRREESLPRDKVTAFNLLGFRYYWALRRNAGLAARLGVHLDYGRQFCRLVLANSHNFSGVDGVYAFPAAAAPLFRRARETGVRTIFEQNSTPIVIDSRLVVEEHIRWPGWELPFPDLPVWEERSEVEQQEWDLADAIICPTPFAAQGLESQGVDPEKIRVVPYGVEVPRFTHDSPPWDGRRPLRLLFAGGVVLRKGVQYLHQALEMLDTPRVSVRLVGYVGLLEPYRNLLRQRAELSGLVPRGEMPRHYEWADVFVFPSISEGSAIVTYEALAAGLPVITTTNAGSMVRHRVDGYVLPIRDSRGLAESIERLLKEPELVAWMSQNARRRAQEYSWERYGERLLKALSSIFSV